MKFSRKKPINYSIMFSLVLMLFIVPFMNRPWLGQVWQFPNEDGFFVLNANVINNNDEDHDDLTLSVLIYDLGIYQRSDRFDLDDYDITSRTFYLDIPRCTRGESLAKISLLGENNQVYDSRFIYLDADYEVDCCEIGY